MTKIKKMMTALLPTLSLSLLAGNLTLAENGKTEYVITAPEKPLPMEQLAVRELQDGLKKTTGVDFKIAPEGKKRIILVRDKSLAPQECELEIKGNDLFLKGGDRFGVVYAVYTLLEDQLGVRWFTRWGDYKYPKYKKLSVDFKTYRRKPAYAERSLASMYPLYVLPTSTPFYFRNRLNNFNTLINSRDLPGTDSLFAFRGPACHTFYNFIPPAKGVYPQSLRFKTEKYYFKDHPEYFSLDSKGKRSIKLQLCFSNPGLRREFARRLFENVELMKEKTGIVTISAQDWPGKFCFCEECKKLEKKYQTPAGPMVDFLLEICLAVQKKYPGIYIATNAYRKGQSEIPPDLKGKRMPDNFICIFAPIDDDFSKPMDHPNNQNTLKNLRGWANICKYVWMWYYPLTYADEEPFVPLTRNVKDIKLMLQYGATGSMFEHDVGRYGLNFFDLLNWLYLKLLQDPNADYRKLVSEYCDFMYGAASKDMQTYLYELDEYSKRNKVHWVWNGGALPAAMTPKNLLRWTKLFDRAEKKVANDPASLARVRDTRFMLNIVALRKYRDINELEPGFLPSPEAFRDRIQRDLQSLLERRFSKHLLFMKESQKKLYASKIRSAYILATFKPKKLDAPLDKVNPKRVREIIPYKVNRCGIRKMADAAYGVAIYHPSNGFELPFTCGFYDFDSKQQWIKKRMITADEIVPDKFHLYKIGSAPIQTRGYIWTMWNWTVGIETKSLYIPGEGTDKKYDIWLSIKFEGPGYSKKSKAKENRFYIDRAVFVDPE